MAEPTQRAGLADWLSQGMRGFVAAAIAEAAERGTSTVEAEHVLLALAKDAALGPRMAAVGLDHGSLSTALSAERRRALAVAGIPPVPAEFLVSTRGADKPRWGASVAAAREREAKSSSRKLGILIGILRAEIGTVPRALALAGLDRVNLIARLSNSG